MRVQYFLQFYFQQYEYDPSMLDFHLSKLLKNFIEDSPSTVNLFIFRFGSRSGMLSFFDDFWKKEYLVFLAFNINLLALNQLLTFVSYLFTFSNKMLMTLRENKRFMSSTNMIGFSIFEAWCKSFTCNKNNKSPKIDLWGTPHITVAFVVELCLNKELQYVQE